MIPFYKNLSPFALVITLLTFFNTLNAQQGRLPTLQEINAKQALLQLYNSSSSAKSMPNHLMVTGPEQDCDNAIPVCQQSYTQTSSYTGHGSIQEVPGSTCLSSQETNSVWYVFTVQNSGTFTFQLNTANDYDFALYNITTIGCTGVPSATPVRCNFSATYGNTGLTLPAAGGNLSYNASQSPLMAGINVTAGQTFVLIVDNFSANSNGYTLTFGGTAQIFDTTPPTISSSNFPCNGSLVTATFSEPVTCASIATNGSDFTITGPSGNVPVTSAVGNLCSTGASNTSLVTVNFNNAGLPSGTYTVSVNTGTDGNTILDKCGNVMTAQSFTFQYLAPVTVSATNSVICAGSPTTLSVTIPGNPSGATYLWSPGGATTQTITVNPSNTITYGVTVTYNGCTRSSSQVITVSQPPVVSVNPTNASLCSGTTNIIASATMNGLPCASCNYTWTGSSSQIDNAVPSSTITGAGAGSYSVTVSTSNGCIGNTAVSNVSILSPASSPVCSIIYASPAGVGTGLTPASPTNLVNALTMSACSSSIIKLETGTYTISAPITNVTSFITIEGGFNAGFTSKTSLAGATRIFRNNTGVQGLPQAGRLVAFEISNASYFRFQDLTIEVEAPAAASVANPYGVSTYGVYLNNCSDYNFVRCQIIAGNASAGLSGTSGVGGVIGANGTKGGDAVGNDCTGTDGNSGNGGNGGGNAGSGALGVVYGCGAPTNGAAGIAGTGLNGGGGGAGGTSRDGSGAAGAGGNGGNGGGGTLGGTTGGTAVSSGGCGTPINGIAGANGAAGANGISGAAGTAGSVLGGYWNAGTQGGNGTNGAGGGGGKGASGGAGDPGGFLCSISGTGGGGGGGGGGGQAGTAGTGGYGGGSAYCVFMLANGASSNLIDCFLTVGTAGSGGTGGTGGIGGNGGIGGARGCADACTGTGEGNGAKGGDGGKGGNGGSGGAGAPGESIAAKLVSGSALSINSTLNLVAQPVINVDNVSCTDMNINYTTVAPTPNWTNLGVGAVPASGSGSPVITQYTSTGRKTVVMNANNYTEFTNILVGAPSTGSVLASVSTICPGAASFLSSAAGTPGFTYSWTAMPAGATISSATTSSTSITFANAGVSPITYTVSLNITSQCCGTLTPVTQTIVVYPIPAAPTASVNAVCIGGVATFTANTPVGSSFDWYNAASSGTLLATGNTYSIAGVSTPTTVYLQATNAGGCASTLTPVAVTPTNIPSPTALSAISCDPGMVQVGITPAAGVSDYSWYSDAGGTTLVQTGTTLNYSQNIPVSGGSYTVYVQSNVAGCTPSALIPVTGSVTGTPIIANNTITANDTVCINTPVTISLAPSGGDGTYSYAWSPVTSTLSTITQTVSASIGYNVIITSGNCSKQFNFPIIVNPYPKDTIGTPAMISCTSPTINLDGTFSASGPTISYSWTTSGGSIVSAANTNTVDVNAPGIYTLTVTDNSSGCASNQTVTVSGNSTIPTLTVSPSNYTITCATSTVTLNANSSTTGLTYLWTTTGGVLSNTNTANPVASAGGTYSVVITNTVNGCQASGTATVVPDAAIPTATVSSNSISLDCINLAETVTVTTTPSADITFTWSPSPASGANSATPSFASAGTYSCVITNTVNMCNTSVQVVVSTNTTVPTITITPTQTLTCASTTAVISTTVNPTSGVSYTWTGTGVTGQTGSSVNVNQAGTYDVLILDAANGCTNTASSSIVSNVVTPTITVTPITTTLTCLTTTINLNATATTTNAPVWATPSGTASNPVIANAPGDYVASVTDASSGCTRTETITITSNTIAPTANAGAITPIPCGALTTTLNGTASPTAGATYSWSGPTVTSIVSGSNTANPTVGETGVYTLTVTGTNGCSSTSTVAVIQGSVNAQFTANPTTGISPLTVDCTDQSVGAITYNWNFGNGNTSTTQNPSNTYSVNGTYTITLIASSGICSDTAYAIIIVESGLTLEIPNVFTPNTDGSNDLFTIKSTGVKEISLQIFNRWGQKLFEFSGPNASWDGKASGEKAPEGTYFYFVKATGFDDKEIEQHGTVNLFR